MRHILFVAAVASVIAAAPAHAQDTPTDHRGVITAQLERASQAQGSHGYTAERALDTQTLIGLLPKGGTVALEITLRGGVQYFIPAVCDTDCEDLDMRVHAPGDNGSLAQDVEDDDVPLLLFTAKRSGTHLLTLKMVECKTEFCYFGFSVLSK